MTPKRIEWKGTPGADLDGADVKMGDVTIELATVGRGLPHVWGVWGVRIDGALYRGPRDLAPEPLRPGSFRDWVEQECERAITKATT